MQRIRSAALAVGLSLAAGASTAIADDLVTSGGRINNLKVLSSNVDDVSTVENILKSFVKPGKSDQDRAKALWTAAIKYRHQTIPPDEYLAGDWEAHDPIKIFNVYGYCMCCCCSSLIEALNRADGREAQGRILNGHSVAETRYRDGWHMFDCSLITYFPKPETGSVASVDEIVGAIATWYAQHPGFKGDSAQVHQLMRSDGWTGWKSKGPELLAHCPFYRMGYLPAGTHGWDATMAEYDLKSSVYEYGYHVGHRALFSLRPGESIVREAGNRGLHVNRDKMPDWGDLKAKAPNNDLVYVKEYLPGYRGGIVANGRHLYAPRLASAGLALGAEVFDNLATGRSPALHPKVGGRRGVTVIPMTSPYVYLGGRLKLKAVRKSANDRVAVSISTNNGRSFAPLWTAEAIGTTSAAVNLDARILRRYAYWLKIEIAAGSPEDAGLDELAVENDIQHAPRTLPWLRMGRNTITVAADSDPALGSRAIACRITADPTFTKNETSGSMGVTFENLEVRDGSCWWHGGTATMTVPVEVPGDLVALRFSAQVRARGEKDLVRMEVSGDNGKTWREAARIAGPTQGKTGAFRFADWPAATRKALLRFVMTGNNTVGVLSFRVDADYRDPLAARSFRPFRVVHRWTENGRERIHSQPITTLPSSYAIEAATEPEMVAVSYEMPSS